MQLAKPGRYTVVSRGLTKTQFFCTGPPDAVPAGDLRGVYVLHVIVSVVL